MPEYLDSTYDVAANTHTAKEQSFAVVEVGDAKQPEVFHPQVKIMRWDNECNFSARLVHKEASPKVALVADKIQWVGDAVEAHFYEIGEGKEGGGYEFEIILKKAPKSNVISMTLQTKGLDFFYQPELTQEEIDHGEIRPDKVIGSYAVYHQTMAGDHTGLGGKNYLAGKAFHIFRPRIEDAEGNWVWGDLNIDDKQGLLTVTIPQDFPDKAVYPVRHAAGLEFGYHVVGGSQNSTGNQTCLFKATAGGSAPGTPASSGIITKLTLYCKISQNNPVFNPGVYNNSSDLPSTKVAGIDSGGSQIPVNYAWLDSPISATIIAGTQYWLGFSNHTGNLYYTFDTITNIQQYANGLAAWPDTWTGNAWNNLASLYATYTESGGSAAKVPFWLFNQAALGQGVA